LHHGGPVASANNSRIRRVASWRGISAGLMSGAAGWCKVI
jgi:hypothetical protein